MSMNRVPSLIIGIGGIGCRIAATVSDLLSEQDREYVGVVGMDTNANDLNKIKAHRVIPIQTSDERKVRDFLRLHPEYTKWFPVNRFTVDRGMLNGAGQIRSISRLAALASEKGGGFTPIQEEIKRIRKMNGQTNKSNLTVMIVGSLTGGTGAGLFLQLPYYIRKVTKSFGLDSIIIRGMFVGPEITANVQPSKINRDAVRVNAYACLKELNAFYMMQNRPEDEENILELDYYDKANATATKIGAAQIKKDFLDSELDDMFADPDAMDAEVINSDSPIIASAGTSIPYDYLYLVEESVASGSIGLADLSSVENQVAHMVFTLMFTPVKDNALSVEDNMVLQDMETGGMGRYSGAGLCRLVFPYQLAREYVSLCTVRDLVKDEWMLIDRKYESLVIDARIRQRTDGTVEIPKLGSTFVDLFKKEVNGDGKLGKLYKEAYLEVSDGVFGPTVISRAQQYLQKIGQYISSFLENDELIQAKNNCAVNEEKMRKFSDAKREVARVSEALDAFTKFAKLYVKKSGEIANEVFPTAWKSLTSRMDQDVCIYQLLSSVHPITARFFCYSLIQLLEKEIKNCEMVASALDLDAMNSEDYDENEDDTQSADVAIRNLEEKHKIGDESKKLMRIRRKFREVSETQTGIIEQYMLENMKLLVFSSILDRLEILAEDYRVFFDSISEMIKENNERIERLEQVEMALGQIGVYCSKEAFRRMASEYRGINADVLPQSTQSKLFEQVFRVFADEYESRSEELTERQKVTRNNKNRQILSNAFHVAVVDTISTEVAKKGAGIVDLNIRQAIIKEFELGGLNEDNCANYDRLSEEYVRNKIAEAMRSAAPLLAVDRSTMETNTETIYMAINPMCAVVRDGQPSAAATRERFIPEASEATDGLLPAVIMDEEFSQYEIICYKARHKFKIESLLRYRDGTENARAYESRLNNLGRSMESIADQNAGIVVVNPHLNRYWNEEGFIPSLSETMRQKSYMDTIRAFVYAIGMDSFVIDVDESRADSASVSASQELDSLFGDSKTQGSVKAGKAWFYKTSRGKILVRKCGQRIGINYSELYDSLRFNRKIKNNILSSATVMMNRKKRFSDPEELFETILSDPFIQDLIQPDSISDENDENVLDIFLEMRKYMSATKWNDLFTGLLETLWEYCGVLFEENEVMVNNTIPEILKRMYYFSSVGRKQKNNEELDYGEKRLKEQVTILLKKRYQK